MKLKTPPQPIVFRFEGPTALCEAVRSLYEVVPNAPSALCGWRGFYFLRVQVGFKTRKRVMVLGARYGVCLGACPVLYAYFQEHGKEISQNPVEDLGGTLGHKKGSAKES